MAETHRIARVIWQAEAGHSDQTHALQNQLSHWSRHHLAAVLTQQFEPYCSAGEYWQIETLELDLGEIPADQLQSCLTQRVSQQLELWLAEWQRQLSAMPYAKPASAASELRQQRHLETLSWFLLHASYPWWHDGSALTQVLTQAMMHNRQSLRLLLVSLGQAEPVRWRLVRQFKMQLPAVLEVLEPGHADWIFDYFQGMMQHQRQQEIFSVADNELEEKLWYTILTQLLLDRGSLFNQVSFLRENLHDLAKQFSISYDELLQQLGLILNWLSIKGVSANRWYTSLHVLQQEQQAALRRSTSASPKHQLMNGGIWRALQQSLLHLRPQSSQDGQRWQLATLLHIARLQDAAYLAECLRGSLNIQATSEFLCKNLLTADLHAVLKVLAPGDYPFIQQHLQQHHKLAKERNWDVASVWHLVLGYLLASNGSYFNRRQFVALSLNKLAENYAVDMLWLLDWMIHSVQQQHPNAHRFELLLIFQELRQYRGKQRAQFARTEQYAVTHNNQDSHLPEFLRNAIDDYLISQHQTASQRGTLLQLGKSGSADLNLPLLQALLHFSDTQRLTALQLAQCLLRQIRSKQTAALWNWLWRTHTLIWPGLQRQFRQLASDLVQHPAILRELRSQLFSQRQFKLHLTALGLQQARFYLQRTAQFNADADAVMIIQQVSESLASSASSGRDTFLAKLHSCCTQLQWQNLFSAYPWYSQFLHRLEAQIITAGAQYQRDFLTIFSKADSADWQSALHRTRLQRSWRAARFIQTRLRANAVADPLSAKNWPRRGDKAARANLVKPASRNSASSTGLARHLLKTYSLQDKLFRAYLARFRGLGFLLKDAQVQSQAGLRYFAVLTAARRQLLQLVYRLSAEFVEAGLTPRQARRQPAGAVTSLRSATLTERAILKHLQLPDFIWRCQSSLSRLHDWIMRNQLWPGNAQSLQLALKEVCATLALSYRGRNLSELDFYFRFLMVLQADYLSSRQNLLSLFAEQALKSDDLIWRQLAQRLRRQQMQQPEQGRAAHLTVIQLSQQSVQELGPEILREFRQDYRLDYLRQPAAILVMLSWLETGRFPEGLREPATWSPRRFWQEALEYGFPWRKLISLSHVTSEQVVPGILTVLDHNQVQKLLIQSSGISRSQSKGLQIWYQHIQHLASAERQELAGLWQFDLLSAWWRGDNQGFHESRLVASLSQFLYRKSARQRAALIKALSPLLKRMPESWREDLQVVLSICPRQAMSGAERANNQQPAQTNRDPGSQTKSTSNHQPDSIKMNSAKSVKAKQTQTQRLAEPTSRNKNSLGADSARNSATETDQAVLVELKQIMQRQQQTQQLDQHLPVNISNAGLVILQSFYATLFERLGYIQQGQFISHEAQCDAALLLHLLSTGQTQANEADLILNKLLVGLEPYESLPAQLDFDVTAVEVCESLLNSVIQYWSAIGSCSVDGFRGNWLVRNASLSDAGDHWRLVVERRAYDVLLARLPLSYSLIRLPWMKKAIYVTWPT